MNKKSVLLVDDEESIRISLSLGLRKKGYVVDTAADGEEAIEKLRQNHFDVVITDLQMDKKSGVEVIKASQELNINLPVLVITGFGESPLFAEAMALKPSGHLLKPFLREELIAKIEHCLARA